MYEIEIKARCDDARLFEEKVKLRGAVFLKEETQSDMYYTHPDRDFKLTDEVLRLRDIDGKKIITYKGPKISARSMARIELETDVADGAVMHNLIIALGFQEMAQVVKKRKTFAFEDILICIDRVANLGDFIELEMKDTIIAQNEATLYALGAELGLHDYTTTSYLEMLQNP